MLNPTQHSPLRWRILVEPRLMVGVCALDAIKQAVAIALTKAGKSRTP